jgi:hypothetical protein
MDPREYSKHELDNHANQCNNNNDAYWQSRGYEERPSDWDTDREDDDDDDRYDGGCSDYGEGPLWSDEY